MTNARHHGKDYEVVNFLSDEVTWVLRAADGDIALIEGDRDVQIECSACGTYTHDVEGTPSGDEWSCRGGCSEADRR